MARKRIAPLLKTCQQCGSEFRPKDQNHAFAFCTRDCWKKSLPQWAEKTCQHCGNTYMARPYMANKQQFCGYACHSAFQRATAAHRTEKPCTVCRVTKSLTEFAKARALLDGHTSICKSCESIKTKRYYAANPDLRRQQKYAWRDANRDKARAIGRRRSARIRQRVIFEYGGKCACCGESESKFLAIDHIYNDGKAHRQHMKETGTPSIFTWLRKHGYPKDRFQLLCHNCNLAKSFYGKCPHGTKRASAKLSVRETATLNLSDAQPLLFQSCG